MSDFRERLRPSAWLHVIALLAVPASMLMLAPVSVLVGTVVGLVLSGGLIALFWGLAPVIEVTEGSLRAGRARIPLTLLGTVDPLAREDARHARGPGLDARAWLLVRGDIDSVVRIEVVDKDDPAPYWLVSTRRPEELALAITSARAAAGA